MKNIKLTNKIIIMLLVLITGMITITIVTYIGFSKVDSELEEISEYQVPLNRVITELEKDILEEEILTYELIIASKNTHSKEFKKLALEIAKLEIETTHQIQQCEILTQKAIHHSHEPKIKTIYQSFQNVCKVLEREQKKFEQTLKQFEHDLETNKLENINHEKEILHKELDRMDKYIIELMHNMEDLLNNSIHQAKKNEKNTLRSIEIVSIIAIIIGLIFGYFLIKDIKIKIYSFHNGLLSFFDYLADPSKKVTSIDIDTNDTDEFGQMTKSVNESIDVSMKMHGEMARLMRTMDQNVITTEVDDKDIITYVSKAFCKISGYKKDELIGKPYSIIRHPDMPEETFEQMWKTLNSDMTWEGEVKNLRKDGSSYWVHTFISPKCTRVGGSCGFTSIQYDITDKKHVEFLQEEIEDTQKEVVFTMGAIGESRSKETGNHVKRVAQYSYLFAIKYGLNQAESELLKQASPMHDIGKVAIPDAILNKPGRFTPEEFDKMKEHSSIGYEMLKYSSRPLLKAAAIVAYEHHERWDGKGYPNGTSEEEIHIYGRITSIADVFDALGSDRCYKKAWDDKKIFNLFKEEKGKQFDPRLVDIFFDNLEEFLKIRDSLKDDL